MVNVAQRKFCAHTDFKKIGGNIGPGHVNFVGRRRPFHLKKPGGLKMAHAATPHYV